MIRTLLATVTPTTPIPGSGDKLNCYTGGGNGLHCMFNQLSAATSGSTLFGILVGGAVLVAYWIAGDGDITVPTVFLIIFGALLAGSLPAQYRSMALALVVVGVMAALYAILKRYVLSWASQ